MYCIKKNRKVLSSAYHEDQAVKNQLTFRFSSSKDYCIGNAFLVMSFYPSSNQASPTIILM